MNCEFSETQKRRLKELDWEPLEAGALFAGETERDQRYQQLEDKLIKGERRRLNSYRQGQRRPGSCLLEQELATRLAEYGFVQVTTPIVMSRSSLKKMGIGEDHPLQSQVFWLDGKQCLRPMLAPHLYSVARDLLRLWEPPVRLFEIGPCFRRESQGSRHSNEFTMLNLVEFGLPEADRQKRLEELAGQVMTWAGVKDYVFADEESEVYGATMDIVNKDDRMELGSSAMGPHPLDRNWRIASTWVGIGFGLERLLMAGRHHANMSRVARSLSYLDGIRLNI